MNGKSIRVLLIEDNPGDVRLIREALVEARGGDFDLVWVDRLSEGLEHLAAGGADVVLLDLGLPDSLGLETLGRVCDQRLGLPIIVLTGMDDEELAMEAVQSGAQDYLFKGRVDGNLLGRSIRYAIERHRMLEELRASSLIDELTGLHNRRGFFTLAEQQLRVAHRTRTEVCLMFIDLDGMKRINDDFGHREGDHALTALAGVLKQTFRESDILARVGADEFLVLAIVNDDAGPEALTARLRDNLRAHQAEGPKGYELAVSIGVSLCSPDNPRGLDELMASADSLMYQEKRSKRPATAF